MLYIKHFPLYWSCYAFRNILVYVVVAEAVAVVVATVAVGQKEMFSDKIILSFSFLVSSIFALFENGTFEFIVHYRENKSKTDDFMSDS